VGAFIVFSPSFFLCPENQEKEKGRRIVWLHLLSGVIDICSKSKY
jgi:hypothetical protein